MPSFGAINSIDFGKTLSLQWRENGRTRKWQSKQMGEQEIHCGGVSGYPNRKAPREVALWGLRCADLGLDGRRALFRQLRGPLGLREVDHTDVLPARRRGHSSSGRTSGHVDTVRRRAVVVHMPARCERIPVQSASRQAIPAATRSVLRMSNLPRADLSKLPRGPSVGAYVVWSRWLERAAGQTHGPEALAR